MNGYSKKKKNYARAACGRCLGHFITLQQHHNSHLPPTHPPTATSTSTSTRTRARHSLSLTHTPPLTSRMYHAIIRIHANSRASKPLVAHGTMPILIHHDPAIEPPRLDPPITPCGLAIAQHHHGFHGCFFHAPQPRDNTFRVERRVGCADAPEEVGFEVAHREGRWNEVKGCGCGEAGAVFGEEL